MGTWSYIFCVQISLSLTSNITGAYRKLVLFKPQKFRDWNCPFGLNLMGNVCIRIIRLEATIIRKDKMKRIRGAELFGEAVPSRQESSGRGQPTIGESKVPRDFRGLAVLCYNCTSFSVGSVGIQPWQSHVSRQCNYCTMYWPCI